MQRKTMPIQACKFERYILWYYYLLCLGSSESTKTASCVKKERGFDQSISNQTVLSHVQFGTFTMYKETIATIQGKIS